MLKKILFVLFAAVSFAPQARALDFDGSSGGSDLKNSLPSIELPAARPIPVAEVKASGCRPFLMSLSVGGISENVTMERACTDENQAVWVLLVDTRGNREIAARVVSDKYPEQRALIEKRIKAMLLEGMSEADADVVINKVGPLLKQASGAAAKEKNALIASATEILKNHLARP